MAVTEIGCMGVQSGLNILDETTREGQILTGAWKFVKSNPEGPHRVSWAVEVEDPLKLWAFFNWDSVEHHEKFAKSFGPEAAKDLPSILTMPEFVKHVAVAPSPPPALTSPMTEVILAYFPREISASGRDAAIARLQRAVQENIKSCPDIQTASYGWGVENDFPVRGGKEGETGRVLMALIGWTDLGASKKFQETDTFKESMGTIESIDGLVQLKRVHLICRTLENQAH